MRLSAPDTEFILPNVVFVCWIGNCNSSLVNKCVIFVTNF